MRHYTLRERSLIALRAALAGKDPLIEVAEAGLKKEGLDERLQTRYALRLIKVPERYFDAIAGTEISDKAREAAKREYGNIRRETIFVFDD